MCRVGEAEDRERLVAAAVKLHGGLDILISNAAVSPFFGNLMDVSDKGSGARDGETRRRLSSDRVLRRSLQPIS